jgi:class 3 adenylate cyclase
MKTLAQRNEELAKRLYELVGKYENFSAQSEQYNQLMKKYGLEETVASSGSIAKKIKRFKMASLLYITISGFDKLFECNNTQKVMDHLDSLTLMIDEVASKYKLLKVKTLGDNFLFVGGVLEENRTNPIDVVMAALEIKKRWIDEGKEYDGFWTLGIGIHTGPVFGEETGRKNTPYKLLGDSVSIVSRLGMSSADNTLRMSVMTYELVKEFVDVSPCGKFPVKYSGLMDVFVINGIIPSFVDPDTGLFNNKFFVKYATIQFMDLQEVILDMMETNLPKNLYYHNIKHTIDVITEVELIGWAEGLDEEQVLLLKVAALFHDAGHTVNYQNHEEHGAAIAADILPRYNYNEQQIATVKRLIMATRVPHHPQDLMEEVMCDSDLDYLGRSDFIPVSNNLFRELKERSLVDNLDEWNNRQLNFINNHQYFTNTAQNLRQVNKQLQLERIKNLISD